MSDLVISIQSRIFSVRGTKVILDSDVAELYSVSTKALNQAVSRNKDRFPQDFMFKLTKKELSNLRSQSVTSSWGGKRYLPYAFTEHGIAMLSGILRSENAIKMNIEIIRAFIALRNLSIHYSELYDKINEFEIRCDLKFSTIDQALDYLLSEKEVEKTMEKRNRIGFKTKD